MDAYCNQVSVSAISCPNTIIQDPSFDMMRYSEFDEREIYSDGDLVEDDPNPMVSQNPLFVGNLVNDNNRWNRYS